MQAAGATEGSLSPDSNEIPQFETSDLAAILERSPPDLIDRLPFGAIHLGSQGEVLRYSATERRLSGFAREAVGLDFYAKIAPCMNNAAFRGRIEAAARAGRLDIEFGHVGDFDDRERELRVRVMSASSGGYWIFMSREE